MYTYKHIEDVFLYHLHFEECPTAKLQLKLPVQFYIYHLLRQEHTFRIIVLSLQQLRQNDNDKYMCMLRCILFGKL